MINSFSKLYVLIGIVLLWTPLLVGAQSAPPANFSLNSISACATRLNWNQGDPGAYYFQYQRSLDNFSSWNEIRVPGSGFLPDAPETGAFVATSTSLFSNNTYWFRVRSCDTGACSAWTTVAPTQTLSLPSDPGTPSISTMSATLSGSNQDVLLTWTMPTTLSGYGGFSLFRSENGGAFQYMGYSPLYSDPQNPGTIRPMEYQDNGLSPDSYYTYKIYAYDTDFGCSIIRDNTSGPTTDPNNQAQFSIGSNERTLPIRPTGLSATYNEGADTVELVWSDNSDFETEHRILKSTNNTFPGGSTSVITVGADVTSYSDSGVLPDQGYFYKIQACNTPSICSGFSNISSASTGIGSSVLKASLVHVATSSHVGRVYIVWTGATGATQYTLQRSLDSGFSSSVNLVTRGSGDVPRYTDSNLPFGEVYYYRVAATGGGQTSYSNVMPINLNMRYVLQGVGWSGYTNGGIGWVKFNSLSENGSTPAPTGYSVHVDADGLVSGEAWASISENIGAPGNAGYGWLSFNKADLEGCPQGTCEARLDLTSGELNGWARFLSPRLFDSSWDGWVSLSGSVVEGGGGGRRDLFSAALSDPEVVQTGEYGVVFDITTGSELNEVAPGSGVAWGGGQVTGWLSFGGADCDQCTARAELINRAPSLSNIQISIPGEGWCEEIPSYRVSWTFEDEDIADSQEAAEVRFTQVGSGVVATTTPVGLDQSMRFFDPLGFTANGSYNGIGYLDQGSNYRVSVRVYDGLDWSDWVAGPATTTPAYYWPLADFSWDPAPTATGTVTTFTDQTDNRSAGASVLNAPVWQFLNANPQTSTSSTVPVVFNRLPSDALLTISDDNGFSCQAVAEVSGGAGTSTPVKRRIFRER